MRKVFTIGELAGLTLGVLPFVLLLLFHFVVACSPWTLSELCRAADAGVPISPLATELTSIGASLHGGAVLFSPLFCLAGFVLCVRAMFQRNTRVQVVTALMAICSAAATIIGHSYFLDLAGF